MLKGETSGDLCKGYTLSAPQIPEEPRNVSTHLNHTTSPLNQIYIQLRAHKRAWLSPGSTTARLLLSICIAYVGGAARGAGSLLGASCRITGQQQPWGHTGPTHVTQKTRGTGHPNPQPGHCPAVTPLSEPDKHIHLYIYRFKQSTGL